MRHLITTLLCLILVCSLNSCTKELPFAPEVEASKLVINSYFSSDSLWKVHLTQSRSVVDTNALDQVQNGVVNIRDGNGTLVTTLIDQGDGFFRSATEIPQQGATYQIEASAPGFEAVTAENRIPTSFQVLSFDTLTTWFEDSSRTMEFEISFQDPPGEQNFYEVGFYRTFERVDFFTGDTIFSYGPLPFSCGDPNVETSQQIEDGLDSYFDQIWLKDETFDGEIHTLKFTIPRWTLDDPIEPDAVLVFANGSEDYYLHRKSHIIAEGTEGNPFAQPVQVYSNIENGYGIFAGRDKISWFIDL